MNDEINFDPNRPQRLKRDKGVITKVPREVIKKMQSKSDLTNPKKRVLTNPNLPKNGGYVATTALIISSIILLSIIIFTGIGNMLGK